MADRNDDDRSLTRQSGNQPPSYSYDSAESITDTVFVASYARRFWLHRINQGYRMNQAERRITDDWLEAEIESYVIPPLIALTGYGISRLLSRSFKIPQRSKPVRYAFSIGMFLGTCKFALRLPFFGIGTAKPLLMNNDPECRLSVECRAAVREYYPHDLHVANFDRANPNFDNEILAKEPFTINSLSPDVLKIVYPFFLRDFRQSSILDQLSEGDEDQLVSKKAEEPHFQSIAERQRSYQEKWPADGWNKLFPEVTPDTSRSSDVSGQQAAKQNEFGDEITKDSIDMPKDERR